MAKARANAPAKPKVKAPAKVTAKAEPIKKVSIIISRGSLDGVYPGLGRSVRRADP